MVMLEYLPRLVVEGRPWLGRAVPMDLTEDPVNECRSLGVAPCVVQLLYSMQQRLNFSLGRGGIGREWEGDGAVELLFGWLGQPQVSKCRQWA